MESGSNCSRIAFRLRALAALSFAALLAGCCTLPEKEGASPQLVISAIIDGSDRVVITQQEAKWEHLSWSPATHVRVNGIRWSLTGSSVLVNEGKTQFLSQLVDFASAKIVSRSGRDIVAIETYPEKIVVYFGDNPNGAAPYRIQIVFAERKH
jgi:hypothetical protein